MQINTENIAEIADALRLHIEAGCNETLADAPQDQFAIAEQERLAKQEAQLAAREKLAEQKEAAREAASEKQSAPAVVRPAPQAELTADATPAEAAAVAAAANTLEELETAMREFDGCSLKQTAKNTVFSDGVFASDGGKRIMLVGEAPGGDEDRAAKPFVGAAGQLLDKAFAAIGLSREKNLYITNLVAWRPIGNRAPTAAEIALCRPFAARHIELAKPDILLLAGNASSKTLLNTELGITKLRGKWAEYDEAGAAIRALPILHPAYLLRRPQTKKDMWADLCLLQKEI